MSESLTPAFDKAVSEAAKTTQEGIRAATDWAGVLWQRMKEPIGEVIDRKFLHFLRAPKTGRRFGRQLRRPLTGLV